MMRLLDKTTASWVFRPYLQEQQRLLVMGQCRKSGDELHDACLACLRHVEGCYSGFSAWCFLQAAWLAEQEAACKAAKEVAQVRHEYCCAWHCVFAPSNAQLTTIRALPCCCPCLFLVAVLYSHLVHQILTQLL